ncbi:MAG: hypothetical protein Aurels2KO_54360 [Aureliella sp.]
MTESNNPLEYEIRQAFLSVSAPADFKQRLRARIRKEAGASSQVLSDAIGDAIEEQGSDNAGPPVSRTSGPEPARVVSDETSTAAHSVPRRGFLISAVAAAALAAFGLFFWPASPMSRQDIALRGIELATALDDGLVAGDDWELNPEWPFAGQLKVSRVLGSTRVSSEHFGGRGKHCDVWKVTDSKSDFYVVQVPGAEASAEVISMFRSVPSSGGWSIAAMQTSDSLVLVIGRSDVDKLILKGQYT